jgi:hypothetical protein
MRSIDPDPHHARLSRSTGDHAPGEEGVHLMSDTTSANVGAESTTPALAATSGPLGRADSK